MMCSPLDSQMKFWIGRGFAEVQILKKGNLTLKPFKKYLDKILRTH